MKIDEFPRPVIKPGQGRAICPTRSQLGHVALKAILDGEETVRKYQLHLLGELDGVFALPNLDRSGYGHRLVKTLRDLIGGTPLDNEGGSFNDVRDEFYRLRTVVDNLSYRVNETQLALDKLVGKVRRAEERLDISSP